MTINKEIISLITFYNDIFKEIENFENITEIVLNNTNKIWYETDKGWGFIKKNTTKEQINNFIISLASFNKDKIDETKPILSGVMPNNDRVQVVIPPASNETSITIRKPSTRHITFDDFVASGFFNEINQNLSELHNDNILCNYLSSSNYIDFIKLAVKSHKNIIICGGTGSGKTTFMKSLIDLIDIEERLITIEDVSEITFHKHENYVHLYYPSEAKKDDYLTSSVLLKSCLRMKPDRILLAELRGSETFDFLNIIMSGHDGGITSCHASSVGDCFNRLLSMASQHETSRTLGVDFLNTLLDSINVIIHIEKDKNYKRRIKEVYFDKYQERQGNE